jgi:hypothetical protein
MTFLNRVMPVHGSTLIRAHQPDNEDANVICLLSGGTQTLSRRVRRVYVITGTAWVSVHGEDIVVNAGGSIVLNRSRYPAVISALQNRPLVYRVEE